MWNLLLRDVKYKYFRVAPKLSGSAKKCAAEYKFSSTQTTETKSTTKYVQRNCYYTNLKQQLQQTVLRGVMNWVPQPLAIW